MKFIHPDIGTVFDWEQLKHAVPTLVIEHPSLFRKLLQEIDAAIAGLPSAAVLSQDNKPLPMSRRAELLTDFIRFDINRKPLLTKICSALEQSAVGPDHYLETQRLLASVENAVADWAFDFSCNISTAKLSVSSLLKAVGVELQEDYVGERGEVEKLVDYIELVREFDCEKLFITVNMRDYYSTDTVRSFMKTVLSHEYTVLMVESKAHEWLEIEKRVVIDKDLCEF